MSHRYRAYPGAEQVEMLVRHCADARFVWNLALEQINYWRPGRPSPPGPAERYEPTPPMSAGFIVMTDPEGNGFCLD